MIKNDKVKKYYKKTVDSNINSLDGFLRQVGKTFLGESINKNILKKILKSINVNLDLTKNDRIMDLGCANGLLTSSIAENVDYIYAYDLSDELISVAKKFQQTNNITYAIDNILDINFKNTGIEKLYMYEVLQHFEYNNLRVLLDKLKKELNSFKLFIGSIPDKELILKFYDTNERKRFLFTKLLENKESHLGNWWYREHILVLCEELELKATIIEQDKELHTAHYRFDVLIEKK